MTIYARVLGGIVVEIIDDPGEDIDKKFHPDVIATLVPEGPGMVENGTWDGSVFGPVPVRLPPSLGDRRSRLANRINSDEGMSAVFDALDARAGEPSGTLLAEALQKIT